MAQKGPSADSRVVPSSAPGPGWACGRIWAGGTAEGGGSEFAFAIPAARTTLGAGAAGAAAKTA